MSSLRDKEVAALNSLLSLSARADGSEEFSDQWKILVYDQDCRDIISPLMNVGALRQRGVTLHLLLNAERDAVPDAPAVYFIRPTEANLKRVVEDCQKALYRSIHLHFVTRIERPLLEKFAQDLVASNATGMIHKIVDQYLDVVSLEPSLFTLNIQDSFIGYNDPSLGEAQIKSFMQRVSMGLLSLVRILGSIPVIRAPNGGAAEMLAHSVFTLLKENLSPRGPAHSLFADSLVSDRPRPLLLIFDRTCDLFPILQHNASYQALVDDLLDHRLNRVTIEATLKDGASNSKKKTYDLNTQSDPFFGKYADAAFPEAVEANEKELAEVSQKEAEIRSKPGSNLDPTSIGLESGGKDLSEAIESLPEILNRKANLEAHTNILHAVMSRVAAREIPTFFELEQAILSSNRQIDKPATLALLRDGTKGRFLDKARLLLLITVCGDSSVLSNKAVQDELDAAFVSGCQAIVPPPAQEEIDRVLASAAFLRRLQNLQAPMNQRFGMSQSSSNAMFTSLLSTAHSRASSIMAKATSLFTKFNPMYVTRVADNLAEGRACPEDESFCYFDPRAGNSAHAPSEARFSEVIVFVVGGGCYAEFFNLQELAKQRIAAAGTLKHVIYGCSELLSGDKFLKQIEKLSGPLPSSSTSASAAAGAGAAAPASK